VIDAHSLFVFAPGFNLRSVRFDDSLIKKRIGLPLPHFQPRFMKWFLQSKDVPNAESPTKVSGWIFGPIRALEKDLRFATAENERLNDEDIRLTAAQRNLDVWQFNSLPSNIDDAQRLYREWLFKLARQCGFSGSGFEVTRVSRSAQEEFSTVSVDIKKAEVDMNGLSRCLNIFDQTGIMHRVSGREIDSPGAQGNPRLVVSFTAKGISVFGSEDRRCRNADIDWLLPDWLLPDGDHALSRRTAVQ
jgi:hypothetical protein